MKRVGRGPSLALAILGVTWIGFAPSPAFAQSADASLAHEGVELRRAGRDAEALAVFEQALAVDGSPRTRAQVALAEEALRLWVAAERDLSAAMAAGSGAWFDEHAKTLASALATIRSHLATLRVEANVEGAELWVNGARVGTLPTASPVRVVAGPLTLEVRAPGFDSQSKSTQADPGTEVEEAFELARPVAPILAPPPAIDKPMTPVNPSPPARPPAPGAGTRGAAWAMLATTVALATGGTVAMLIRESNVASYNDDSRCFYGGLTRDQLCGDYRHAADIAQAVGVIEFGAAATAAVLSVVLFELPTTGSVAGVACSVGIGVQCGRSF